jgi:hypothetical protein
MRPILSQSELYSTRNRAAIARRRDTASREGSVLIRVWVGEWGRARPEAAAGFAYPCTKTFRVPSQHSVLVLAPAQREFHHFHSSPHAARRPFRVRGCALADSLLASLHRLYAARCPSAFPRSWWPAAFLPPARLGSVRRPPPIG